MLVVLTEQQILSVKQVCSNCLMANHAGLPRWNKGKLSCGRLLDSGKVSSVECARACAQVYECQMGFHLTNID